MRSVTILDACRETPINTERQDSGRDEAHDPKPNLPQDNLVGPSSAAPRCCVERKVRGRLIPN
jgi:hypothetical protein